MDTPQRPLYAPGALAPLLRPRSIAIVGASDRPGSLGARALANLAGYEGAVFPVSERLSEIGGRRCYPRLSALPEAPDCVVLAIPAAAIETVLAECAAAGARAAVVFASGYAELQTAEGLAAQSALSRIAREADLRLVGPNTTGFANLVTGAHCGFAEFPHGYRPSRGTIAIVSQSGAMGLGLSQAAEHGVSISHVLTAGNSADVDVADFLAALAVEPEVRAVALAFEGVASPERLEEAARAVLAAGKPVAAIKLGRSAAGAAAARWHTASNTGDAARWSDLFARCGIVEVTDLARLIETAAFLAKSGDLPRPTAAPAIAILSSSGGMGILAADAAARHGIATPQPSDGTARALAAHLPAFGSPRNPCDATAQATSNPESLVRCADALLADPRFDALVLPWGKAWVSPCFDALSEVAASHGKPLCLVWMSQWLEGPGAAEAERLEQVSVFRSLDGCMAALRARAVRRH